jgi:cytochrome P450
MLNILAGGNTTSAIIRATVYYLSKYPAAYDKITAELDGANLSFSSKWKEISDLTYLDAVPREPSRINPGLAMVLEQVVPAGGFTLPDRRFIPAGTKVGINLTVVTPDFEVFDADADELKPDRWIKRDDKSYDDFQVGYRQMRDVADFIFGGGGRVCMGRYLATLEIWKLFATLYSVFDMRLIVPEHVWKYRNARFVYQYDMPCYVQKRVKGAKKEAVA